MINTISIPVGLDRLQTDVPLVSGAKPKRIKGFGTLGSRVYVRQLLTHLREEKPYSATV